MAKPKLVNEKIIDSITQTNTKVLGDTPAMAMGNLFNAFSLASSNMSLNQSSTQQQAGIVIQAATVQGVNSLSSIGSSVLGRAAEGIIEKD